MIDTKHLNHATTRDETNLRDRRDSTRESPMPPLILPYRNAQAVRHA
jgi:hypothetical protein